MALRGLVGRERDLRAVDDLVRALRTGVGSVLLVEGEAGIGKTELIRQALAGSSDDDVAVLVGRAQPLERSRPFGVLAEAFDLDPRSEDGRRREIGRLLAGEVPSRDAHHRVAPQIVELVEILCQRSPVLVVLEDLHWADASSLSVISALLRDLRGAPFSMLGSMRPAPRPRELDDLLDEVARSGAEVIRLAPLSDADVGELVELELGGRPGSELQSVAARAAGNPLLVVELLRALVSEGWLHREGDLVDTSATELPDSLRGLVLRRLGYLPSATLELLRLASVLGERVSVSDLAVVARTTPATVVADLGEAFRAKLLDERAAQLVFRHQLVQQAIYEDVPLPLRRALHRDAAAALARAGASAIGIVDHLLVGADHGDLEAVRWLRDAAGHAAGSSPTTAVDLLERARDLLPAGHADVDLVTSELAAALLQAGRVDHAVATAGEALDRPHRSDVDVGLRLTVLDALSLQDRPDELLAHASAALDSPLLRAGERALVLTQASYGRIFSGDGAGGETSAREAHDVAVAAGSAEMVCWSLAALSVALKTQGRYEEALDAARAAVAAAFDPSDSSARRRHPHFFLGMALSDVDQPDAARDAFVTALAESDVLGGGWLVPDVVLQMGELRFLVGAWDDALAELEAGVELAQRHGHRVTIPQSWAYRSMIHLARGEDDHARAAVQAVEVGSRTYGAEAVAVARSAVAEADGDMVAAVDVLARAWDDARTNGVRHWDRLLAPPLVRLALATDRPTLAQDVVAGMEASRALAPDVPSLRGAALRCQGLVQGDGAVVVAATEVLRGCGRRVEAAVTCEEAATVLLAAGDASGAAAQLDLAQQEYEAVGAVAWSDRVAGARRRLGGRRGGGVARRRPAVGWGSLTRSELAVAELVSQGLTNREVAGRLYVSPHTVNTHLRHIFQKLEVGNRAALARVVAEHHASE